MLCERFALDSRRKRNEMDSLLFAILPIIAILAVVVSIVSAGYVKAPPDKAIIISGMRKEPKVLTGRAGLKIPFFERTDSLYLKQVTVPVISRAIPTKDFINVNIEAVIKVRICPESDTINLAMKNFLNKTPDMIIDDLQDSLQGNMREIVGGLSLEELSQNKERFSAEIRNAADSDMKALGVEIVTCNIQNVTDDQRLIENLGAYNTANITKKASIVKAEARRDVEVAEASAQKEANDARVKAQLEIAQKNNELAIREAELKKVADTEQAKADAASKIEEQEQRKTIEQASTNADIAKREREIELRKREAEVMEQSLDAEVKKKAEAERFRMQQEADAKLYQRQQEAEAEKAEADAERYKEEQRAKAIEIAGRAEAEAIRARGMAEAEAIDKKAEAMKKYGQAAILEMAFNILPEVAKSVAEPIAAIDSVNIYGSDSSGVSDLSGNVPVMMAKTFETIKAATGIDMSDIVRAESFDAKVTKNVNVTGLENLSVSGISAVEALAQD